MHAFTVCDSVSAFAGIGKVRPLKKLLVTKEYQRTFQQLGSNLLMSEDLLLQLESFVCDLYGAKKDTTDVNQCRYAVFRAKKGEAESHQLPPCQYSLYKHCQRANYQAAIWRNSLQNSVIPSPVGHGWSLVSDGTKERLAVDWMSGLPAPKAVIELMSCMCKKEYKDSSCDCIRNGLKCSDICRLTTCSNQPEEEDDLHVGYDEEDVEFE